MERAIQQHLLDSLSAFGDRAPFLILPLWLQQHAPWSESPPQDKIEAA